MPCRPRWLPVTRRSRESTAMRTTGFSNCAETSVAFMRLRLCSCLGHGFIKVGCILTGDCHLERAGHCKPVVSLSGRKPGQGVSLQQSPDEMHFQ